MKGEIQVSGVIGTNLVAQVAFLVNDIHETLKKYEEFLGVKGTEPELAGDLGVIKTQYLGQPAPLSNCYLSFLPVGENLTIELIQPNEHPSTWRDCLNANGEGFHHIAFCVKDADEAAKACVDFGMEVKQRGIYGDQSGQYIYLDATAQLKTYIELLHSFAQK